MITHLTNSPELQAEIDAWLEKHHKAANGHWIKNIKERTACNLNTQVLTIGMTGTGKSLHNIASCLMLQRDFSVDNITFSPVDVLKLLTSGKLKPGDCVIMEEAGVQINSASWQSKEVKLFSQFFETIRRMRINFFLNCPNRSNIAKTIRNLMHAEATPLFINRQNKTCVCKAFLLQTSPTDPEPYRHFLTKKETGEPIPTWTTPLPPAGFIKAYEEKRDAFQQMLNQKTLKALKELHGEGEDKLRKSVCEACGKFSKSRLLNENDIPPKCRRCSSNRTKWYDEPKEEGTKS